MNEKEKLIALAKDLVENGGVEEILKRSREDNIGEGDNDEAKKNKIRKSQKESKGDLLLIKGKFEKALKIPQGV